MRGLYIFGALNIVGWILACIGVFVLYAAIRYKLFTKAGEAGWKSFIPVYGDYIEYKIVWSTKWFWINLIAAGASGMLVFIPLVGPIIAVAGMLVAYFISVFFNLQMAKAFGKSEGFGIGLLVCPAIFKFLIAFDNDIQYIGPQKDPAIFSKAKDEASEMFNKSKDEKVKEDVSTEEPITECASCTFSAPEADEDDLDDMSDIQIEKL